MAERTPADQGWIDRLRVAQGRDGGDGGKEVERKGVRRREGRGGKRNIEGINENKEMPKSKGLDGAEGFARMSDMVAMYGR